MSPAAGGILIDHEAELLALIWLKSVAWFCLHFCWLISILDLYSLLIRSIVGHFFFFGAWKRQEEADHQSKTMNHTSKILQREASEPCNCCCDDQSSTSVDNESTTQYHHDVNCDQALIMSEVEVKMVMERLGLCCQDQAGGGGGGGGKIQGLQLPLGSGEMATLFDEMEPSLEEVKEAFDVFDANNDGYIDVNELQKVLGAVLGFNSSTQVLLPERVCQGMIATYDEDGDGRINFSEFVKLIEKSFY